MQKLKSSKLASTQSEETLMRRAFQCLALIAVALMGSVPPAQAASADVFRNCSLLTTKYPNGVAKDAKSQAAAVDQGQKKASVNKKVYDLNYKRLDRDKDGVVCES